MNSKEHMVTDRQKQIIQAAMEIMVEQGTQKLTIRNVANAIGVTEPAVYRHFASKHDLLASLLAYLQGEIAPVFNAVDPGRSTFAETLATVIGALFDQLESNPAYALFVFTEEAFHADNELRPLLDKMLSTMLHTLEQLVATFQQTGQCRQDLPARAIALTMLGLIRLTVTQWHLHGRTEPLARQKAPVTDTLTTLFR